MSRTVTVNESEPALPAASVVEQSTGVVPNGNVLPDAEAQDTTGFA